MPTEGSTIDLEDPLQRYSYLSLFPRTCRNLGVVVNPTDSSDLESVHNVLKTVGLKETSRRVEQARMIVESSAEDNVSAAVPKESEAVGLVDDGIVRQRRPGLGRPKSKFVFNRRLSQPAVIKEPELDITKLKDPVEFFLAHERLENVKKELRKLNGTYSETDIDINDISLKARPRRPGIPGRRKATFKPYSLYGVSNDDVSKESFAEKTDKDLTSSLSPLPESFCLSQDNSKENRQCPFNEETLPEAIVPAKDGVLVGSISEVNGFLDEILSGTYDHFNSEEQLTLLREQLQLKPITIENLTLPKMPDIPKYDFKISGNLSKPRKSIHDIQAALSGMNNITLVKSTLTPGSGRFSASPTPPKSPFANLSLLKKRLLESSSSKDSFSEFTDDPCLASGSSPVNGADKQPDSAGVQVHSVSKFKVFTYDGDIAALSDESLPHELLQESCGLPNPVDGISTVVATASSIPSNKFGSAVGDENSVPAEPWSTADFYNVSPISKQSDAKMQSGNATVVPNSSVPNPCMGDQHNSPIARSHGNLQSTISNQCSAEHKDTQVEGDFSRSTSQKTRRKTVPVHRTTTVRRRRDGIAADGTDAQKQDPTRTEVQAEHVSMRTNSTLHESSMDNSCSLGVELHEKQSKHPDTGSAPKKVPKNHVMSVNRKRKGDSSPIQEHDVTLESRKKQKGKGGVLRKSNADAGVASEKEYRGDQSTDGGLYDNESEMPNNYPEQQEEPIVAENVPIASLNKKHGTNEPMDQTEESMHPRKKAKRKELTLRKSIAVAGTSFEAGVRKSSRHRSRPLEFWKGERYLYARLEPDSTLPTLIGIKKFDTPDKEDGKSALLKVKDMVDGKKYRELIDLVALH